MTHEQKPESAEFRTQKWDGLPENQANDGWHWLTHEITNSPTPYLWKALSGVWIGDSGLQFYPNSAWCARRQYIGRARVPAEEMAEQRREDAEIDDPVGWCLVTSDDDIINGLHEEKRHAEGYPQRYSTDTLEPLYRRPANVAALEARVKELEVQLGAMQNGTVRQVIHSPLRHFKPEDRS